MPQHIDFHDIAHQATEIYFRRNKKACIKFCVVDALREKQGRKFYLKSLISLSIVEHALHNDVWGGLTDRIDLISAIKKVNLSEQEKYVIDSKLKGHPMIKIARKLKVTESRVSQIYGAVIKKLRIFLEVKNGDQT